MNLIIQDASLEEITAICYRIGEPDFRETVEAQRKFGVVEYLVNNDKATLDEAMNEYDKNVENKRIEVAVDKGVLEEIPPDFFDDSEEEKPKEEPKEKPKKEKDLHLNEPPKVSEEKKVNLQESLTQAATQLVQKKGAKALTDILAEYQVKSIPELNKNHFESVLSKIKEVLG